MAPVFSDWTSFTVVKMTCGTWMTLLICVILNLIDFENVLIHQGDELDPYPASRRKNSTKDKTINLCSGCNLEMSIFFM